MQEGVHENPDVLLDPFERALYVQGLETCSHVVAFRVRAHELFQPRSLSRTCSALRSSSAIVVIRSFAALKSVSSRSTYTSHLATKHSTPPEALGIEPEPRTVPAPFVVH